MQGSDKGSRYEGVFVGNREFFEYRVLEHVRSAIPKWTKLIIEAVFKTLC